MDLCRVWGSAGIYSILRYHIAGDVSWSHFPRRRGRGAYPISLIAVTVAAIPIVAIWFTLIHAFQLTGALIALFPIFVLSFLWTVLREVRAEAVAR